MKRTWTAVAVLTVISAAPATAGSDGGDGAGRMLLAGPAVLLAALAALAVIYLIAITLSRQENLTNLALSSASTIWDRTGLHTLWGVLAAVMLLSGAAIASKAHVLGPFVVVCWFVLLTLVGLGACVVAIASGNRLHAEFVGGSVNPLEALGIGLRLLFVAVALPVVGWFVVGFFVATGIGVILAARSSGATAARTEDDLPGST